jgi:hypothetical protein
MKRLVAGLLLLVGLAAAAEDPWQRDHAALLDGLARHYSNFEDLLTERRLDLPALAARDRAALADASTDAERRRVFERLLRDLRDPHVRIDWAPAAAGGGPGPVCDPELQRLATRPGVAFARLPGWRALVGADGSLFAAGVVAPPGRDPFGVLRLPIFIESAYAAACSHAAAALRMSASDSCDAACTERRDDLAAGFLNDALRRNVAALEAAGARRLVLDVTDNGGGSDWSESVARLLAGRLQSARVAMLRHPAWLAWIDRQLASAGPAEAALLRRARTQVVQGCDLSAAWQDRELALGLKTLPCHTLVADSGLHTLGMTDPGSGPAHGATRLPIVVLINDDTHSSAEQFAALLRDNRRARLVGAVSAGAGCGHFTGDDGTAFKLPASGAVVHVPDCVRLRVDGSNERRGITPDRLLPWAPSDSAWQRAVKAATVLSSAAAP